MLFFTRLPASESLSLAWPRESNHCAAGAARTAQLARRAQGRSPESREGHPDAAVSGLLPFDFAKRFQGWLTVHPCTDSQLARILASHPVGNSSTASPLHRGPSHCASCAAKPKQYPARFGISFFSFSPCGRRCRLRRQDAEANGGAGPEGVPQERHVKRMRGALATALVSCC